MLENWPLANRSRTNPKPQRNRWGGGPFRQSVKKKTKNQLKPMEQYPMAVSPLPATRSPRDNSAPREGASRTHIATARMQTFVQWLRSAQLAIGWAVMLLILGAAAGVYLHQVSTTALVGRNAELLDIELHSLRETNAQVRQQIALMQSLDRMQERTYSYNLQFIDSSPEAIEYLEVIIPAPVTPPPEAIAPLVPPPDTLGQALLLLAYENVSVLGRGFSNGE